MSAQYWLGPAEGEVVVKGEGEGEGDAAGERFSEGDRRGEGGESKSSPKSCATIAFQEWRVKFSNEGEPVRDIVIGRRGFACAREN